jgi:hypothetical protein
MNNKLKKVLLFLAILTFLFSYKLNAQVSVQDSAIGISMLYPSFAMQLPGGDLKDRFGFSSSIGPGFMYKTKSNWLICAEAGFIFGKDVKDEERILEHISTSEGWVIDANGTYAEIHMYERGFTGMAGVGKLLPGLGPNPNSGILFMLKAGYLQHKIRIENPGKAAPQIAGDYKKGYDRLSDGPAINEFAGYMFMGNKRITSFFGGISCTQSWTRSRRIFDFHDMKKDDAVHMDLLYEVKLGWIIPFYKKTAREYYYN